MPTPLQVIEEALATQLVNDDGEPVTLTLRPPLSEVELATLEATLPGPLPADVRQLLQRCSGIDGTAVEVLDFTGADNDVDTSELVPRGVPIAADGFGNFWVAEVPPDATTWGPVWYLCHDPPVLVYQSATLAGFLDALFASHRPPHTSTVDDVHERHAYTAWRDTSRVLTQAAALASEDPVQRAFAETLGADFELVDLRDATTGDGFAWGRHGPRAEVRRDARLPLFAVRRPKASWWRRWLG